MLIIVKQLLLIVLTIILIWYDFCSSVFQLTAATSNWKIETQRENIYVLMQNNRFEVKMWC